MYLLIKCRHQNRLCYDIVAEHDLPLFLKTYGIENYVVIESDNDPVYLDDRWGFDLGAVLEVWTPEP